MISVLVGTRPEIVKMAPVIRAFADRGIEVDLIHSGQHYDYELDGVFFDELAVRRPDAMLDIGAVAPGDQVAIVREGVRERIGKSGSRLVLVQGDTNTVMGAALGAQDVGVPVGHVEAGLRCRDLEMAEERNRRACDQIASLLFAPTADARANLLAENVGGEVHVTGNTVVDELTRQLGELQSRVLERFNVSPSSYLLATVHRAETVRRPGRLADVMAGLAAVAKDTGCPVLLPLHPNTRARLESAGAASEPWLRWLPALGYHEFLALHRSARLTLTDSGGVQEEACVLRVPCVVLRETTERPEAIAVGAAWVGGIEAEGIRAAARQALSVRRDWPNPFGDGKAGPRIAQIVETFLAARVPVAKASC